MDNIMQFPETFEEFAKSYGFKDSKEIYTNGSELIPVFRVEQWLEHARVERTCHLIYCPDVLAGSKQYMCSSCRTYQSDGITYCPNCGAKVVK